MWAEEKVNLNAHFDLQLSFQHVLFKKPPKKHHRKCVLCVTDDSYKPIQKEGAGMWWERGDKYFDVYEFFFGYTLVSIKAPISFHISS